MADAEKPISIPSGAIKRKQAIINHKNVTKISIPSGAIKRMHVRRFLLLLANFNSFWCD